MPPEDRAIEPRVVGDGDDVVGHLAPAQVRERLVDAETVPALDGLAVAAHVQGDHGDLVGDGRVRRGLLLADAAERAVHGDHPEGGAAGANASGGGGGGGPRIFFRTLPVLFLLLLPLRRLFIFTPGRFRPGGVVVVGRIVGRAAAADEEARHALAGAPQLVADVGGQGRLVLHELAAEDGEPGDLEQLREGVVVEAVARGERREVRLRRVAIIPSP